MATLRQYLAPEEATFGASAFPQYVRNYGTSFTVSGLAYDASAAEVAYWKFNPAGYGSGNVTADVIWYADTSTTSTHGVTWQVAIAAITPGTDTQNVETKAFATAQQASTDLGSTNAQKLMKTTVTISNLDSIAADDEVWIKVTRLVSDANDDLTGDAILTSVRLSYSDT
ncbi:hypothetical protein MF672_038845 [Actinomadura sp. ATCC 31491]|uniref:Uncharacterized protein n=1 Tax=Actinomadura luzonensis TaxID=2805427 RepID=A0ABT0G556_9ACTN|nr:hypothetical protein [Actinomadura luzonensis]MCK2219712.1 hypothetical protein [Actinomadura luzonensis]